MPHPIICQDERLRQYLQSFRALFSLPQYEHFVTVLMGQLLGEAGHTLSHVHRAVSGKKSLSSLSRFLSDSPWSHHSIIQHNFARFCREVQPKIDKERQEMLEERKKQKRRGKRPVPFVTGYLIGDDSTMYKPKGVKMQGIGKHHSTTYETQVTGHSLVQCLYTISDRSCPGKLDEYSNANAGLRASCSNFHPKNSWTKVRTNFQSQTYSWQYNIFHDIRCHFLFPSIAWKLRLWMQH